MTKFWVDFSGYACVEAENADEADQKMWNAIHKAFDGREVFDDVWDINDITPVEDEPVYGGTPSTSELEDFWNDK